MDMFLREIHSEAFKAWILTQTSDAYDLRINPSNENKIIIETSYAYGEIGFYSMDIIELSVVSKKDGRQEFYLHFQMNTMKHATELFEEMVDCILSIGDQSAIRVLLCCSGGLTTGYFVELLNQQVELFKFNYSFTALPYTKIDQEAKNYQVILLAPQIGYMLDEVSKKHKDHLVLTIPTAVFGKYNASELITLVHFELDRLKKKKEEAKRNVQLKKNIEITQQVMVISSFIVRNKAHIFCRIYDKYKNILFDKEIIKNKLSLDDITDTIEMVLLDFPDIERIGISLPGIVNDGKLTLPQEGFNNTDIIGMLESKYQKKIVLSNDINSVAVGYYASQDEHSNLSFLYQDEGRYAGLGSIVNGQLITGYNSIVGELKFLPLQKYVDTIELSKTREGLLSTLAMYIVNVITMIGSDLIIVKCRYLDNVNEIRDEVSKYIPKEYIPQIIIAEEIDEYILLGQMILTVEA